MNLYEMMRNVAVEEAVCGGRPADLRSVEIANIGFDSRKVGEGWLFVAQRGVHADGHDFIDTAVGRGALAVLCEELPSCQRGGVTYVRVANSSRALGIAAANYYGNPSQKLRLIGITGTNGKTTTVTLLQRMFMLKGFHTGLLSTIVNKIDDKEYASTHTTPDALELNSMLAEMAEAGCQYCFMEVSSHAIVQDRIAGLQFYGAIFSNITHDHLDFHKTMAEYIAAKKRFFDQLQPSAFALTNLDDKNGMVMVQNCKGRVHTYSLRQMADFRGKILASTFEGLQMQINGTEVWTRLVGQFNAYNLLAIYGTAVLCGIENGSALRLLSELEAAEGRFEYVRGRGITAIVDYAHTPDALQNVLSTIHGVRTSNQNIVTVVGCGGDRDPLKRPIMAKIAVQNSDKLILTSDNPRTEDPDKILDAMEGGLTPEECGLVIRITDRRQAIKTACMIAREGDIVLVAGKGHEKYQEINGVRHHFDDKEELRKLLCNENS